MTRLASFIVIVSLMLAGIYAIGLRQDADAQNMAGHPVVGTWFWENISSDPFDDSYAVFGADGTYVEETTYIGAGIGAWVPTGERTADIIIIYQDIEGGLDPNEPAAFVPGTATLRLSVELDEASDTLVGRGPFEMRSKDGTVLSEETYEFRAQRVVVGWTLPVATPAPE